MSDSRDGALPSRSDPFSSRDTSPDAALGARHPERSPTPNSVRAFAEARQRGRGDSVNESQRFAKKKSKRRMSGGQHGIIPGTTLEPSRSRHSQRHTPERPSASPAASRSTEGNVCDPVQREHLEDRLSIDFDCLETLIKSETFEQPVLHTFANLAPKSTDAIQTPMITADGDFVNVPSWASIKSEKQGLSQDPGDSLRHEDPNRFSFFSSARDTSVHAAQFRDLLNPGEDVRQLFCFPEGTTDGVWWLHVNNPAKEELRAICAAFRIHPLTLEDINTQESREKIELFRSYYFASFRSFNIVNEPDGVDFVPFNMYLVVFREGAITFSYAPEAHASRVRLRIARLKEYVSLSSDWICYALIDDIVDSFYPPIKQIESDADTIEDEVLITRPDDHQEFLRRMGRVRTDLMSLMRLLGGKPDVLRAFAKRCNENYHITPRMDIGLYLGDIQDHVVTMMNGLTQSERMLSRCHASHLAQLSINNIDQGNRTIKFLSRVTVLAAALVPLNLVCFLFGMNIKVPWEDDDNLNAFLGLMSFIILIGLLAILAALRMKYT